MKKINSSKDIVLVLPPKRFKEHRYSLGVMSISGYLRDHGYDNMIIDSHILEDNYRYDREQARKDIIDKVVELKPQVVGFTATTMEINEVIWLNQQIQSRWKCLSVIGGPHSTAASIEVVGAGFDIAVVGEGEATILDIIERFDRDHLDLSSISGIAWSNDAGEIIVNDPREFIDISNMSLPAYDKVDMKRHTKIWDDVIRGVPMKAVMVMASRGCPYSCTFCACNKVFGRRVRYRDLENIKVEIKLLKEKYGVEGIWFADDTLTISYDHVKKVCQIMKDLKMYWGAQSRVDLTNEEIVKLMSESGCLQLDFGVESGNQRILDKVINKKIKLIDVEKAFELCHKYNIRTQASFIIGFPGETRDEMKDTFNFAKRINANSYSFNVLIPLPGTEIYEKHFKDDIKTEDYKEVGFHHLGLKFNKSKVDNVQELHEIWRKKLYEGVKKRELVNFFRVLILWFKLGNKHERFDFILFKVKRGIKYLVDKIKNNF